MKFTNVGLALGMILKFHTSVTKGFKPKVKKFLGLISTSVEVTGEKLVGGGRIFAPSAIMKRVNARRKYFRKKVFVYYR